MFPVTERVEATGALLVLNKILQKLLIVYNGKTPQVNAMPQNTKARTFDPSLASMLSSFGKLPKGEARVRVERSKQFDGKQFQNELPTVMMAERFGMLKAMLQFFKPRLAATPRAAMRLHKTDLRNTGAHGDSIVWFGHSSYLLSVNGLKLLVDPVFSGHASPFPGMVKEFEGTRLYTAVDFPELDVLVITHDHYDHLDYQFVKQIKSKVKRVVCSLGVGAHLQKWGYASDVITELDWLESYAGNNFSLKAREARHFSGRLQRNQSLWSSFVLRTGDKTILIGGDSGYGPHFKRIGEQEGPFDLVLLECGQYNVQWPLIHMQPEETVQAAKDLGANILMPVHWGKFKLAFHNWDESPERALKAAHELEQAVLLPAIAEEVSLYQPYTQHWWRNIRT